MTHPRKRTLVNVSVVAAIILLCFQLRCGSRSYTIEDPAKADTIIYTKPWFGGGFSYVTLHAEGELKKGSALVEIHQELNQFSTTEAAALKQRLKGTFDTTRSYDYYARRAYILYKPKGVAEGKVKLTIWIR